MGASWDLASDLTWSLTRGLTGGIGGEDLYVNMASTNIIALSGDSRTQQAVSTARTYQTTDPTDPITNALSRNAAGWVDHMMKGLGSSVVLPTGCQFAIGGENTADIATHSAQDAAQAVSLGATTMFFLAGVNDGSLTLNQSIANYQSIFQDFADAGLDIIVLSELPKDSSEGNSVNHLGRKDWLLDPARLGEYPILKQIDVFTPCLKSGTVVSWKDGYSYDGLHPNYLGSKTIGETVAADLGGIFPVETYPSLIELPTAINTANFLNPTSCLMEGTGGTATYGDVATGWTISTLPSGGSLTTSKGVDPDGYDEQILDLSGTSTGSAPIFTLQSTTPSNNIKAIAAGQKIVMVGRLRVDSGHSGLLGVQMGVIIQGSELDAPADGFRLRDASCFAGLYSPGGDSFVIPTGESIDYTFRTPELEMPANWAAASGNLGFVKLRPTFNENSSYSALVRISRIGVEVV